MGEHKRRCILLAAAAGLMALLMTLDRATADTPGHLVLAQAGSTGGTIGKKGKSVSGGVVRDKPKTSPARQPRAQRSGRSGCGRVAGTWSWFLGGDVIIRSNGTYRQPASGLTGRWSCRGGQIIMVWSHGYTDKMRLSADGQRLSGSNNIGFHISGTRK